MKLLVKFPTRNRPQRFLDVLSQYVESSEDKENIHYLISIDHDDPKMTDEVCKEAASIVGKNITIIRDSSAGKIHACNRDMDKAPDEWDVVILASDDMLPRAQGWDNVIRGEFEKYFPDTDGCLWFYDGHQSRICTMSIIGHKYYDRFGYLYHPDYISLWCDNEFTDIAVDMGKMGLYDKMLFFHDHHIWTRQADKNDALYKKNDAYFDQDKRTYMRRKAAGFPK